MKTMNERSNYKKSAAGKQRRQKQVLRYRILLAALAVVLLIIISIFLLKGNGNITTEGKQPVNEACESYRPQVQEIAAQYDMSKYVDLIMAVMMQESSGIGPDVMQAAESGSNTRYPNEPGGIQDSAYSIDCGIRELKSVLEKAGVSGPKDLEKIEQALQAYNFGLVYLDYSVENGYRSWSEESAEAFAQMASGGVTRGENEAEAMGMWQYGDQKYPMHVLRYYTP